MTENQVRKHQNVRNEFDLFSCCTQMSMKPPAVSMEHYMQAMMKPGQTQTPQKMQLFQREQEKFKQLQGKKQQLQQAMLQLEQELMKVQGAMEILQQL